MSRRATGLWALGSGQTTRRLALPRSSPLRTFARRQLCLEHGAELSEKYIWPVPRAQRPAAHER